MHLELFQSMKIRRLTYNRDHNRIPFENHALKVQFFDVELHRQAGVTMNMPSHSLDWWLEFGPRPHLHL